MGPAMELFKDCHARVIANDGTVSLLSGNRCYAASRAPRFSPLASKRASSKNSSRWRQVPYEPRVFGYVE
jgi:hypothetical protein